MYTLLELEDSFKYKHVSVLPRMYKTHKGAEYVDSYGYVMTVTNITYIKDKKCSFAKARTIRATFNALNKARNSEWVMRSSRNKEKA